MTTKKAFTRIWPKTELELHEIYNCAAEIKKKKGSQKKFTLSDYDPWMPMGKNTTRYKLSFFHQISCYILSNLESFRMSDAM